MLTFRSREGNECSFFVEAKVEIEESDFLLSSEENETTNAKVQRILIVRRCEMLFYIVVILYFKSQ